MAVVCGETFTLTLDDERHMWFCGSLNYTEHQYAQYCSVSTPIPISDVTDVVGIAAGSGHFACVDGTGHVWTCGVNTCGQLGISCTGYSDAMSMVEGAEDAVSIACGGKFTLFLTSGGDVFGFGNNDYGQLGIEISSKFTLFPASRDVYSPNKMLVVKEVVSIHCGYTNSLLLDKNGDVFACGSNIYYELGMDGEYEGLLSFMGFGTRKKYQEIPIKNPHLSDIVSISCGLHCAIVMNSKNQVFGFGRNDFGQLGFHSLQFNSDINKPTLIPITFQVKSFTCSFKRSFTLDVEGNVWACGNNQFPLPLPKGTRSNFSKIQSFSEITTIFKGISHHNVFKSTSGIWVYGNNDKMQLAPDAFEENYKSSISKVKKWRDEFSHVIGTPIEERRFKKACS